MPERLIYLAGAASRSGDGRLLLGGLLHYLAAQAGLGDAVEASYRATPDGEPLPYDRSDASRPLAESVRAVQSILGRERRDLGLDGRLHLLGWSLGGAVLFEAAAGLLASDARWKGVFATVVTLSSPLLGCDVDGILELGDVAAGEAGRELCRRGGDPAHREWAHRSAAHLRAAGTRVLTLGAAHDAVVTPADSVLPPVGQPSERYVVAPRPRMGADFTERRLGHGAMLADPRTWRLVLGAITGGDPD